MTIVKKFTSDLSSVTATIIDKLSGDCGWSGISRFECQMQGCCWQPNKGADPLDDEQGRCIRHFDMNDYNDDEKFILAINHALTSEEENEENSEESENDDSKNVPHFGGSLPIGPGYNPNTGSMQNSWNSNNPFMQNRGNQMSLNSLFGQTQVQQPFSPFFGRKRKKRSIFNNFGGFRQSYGQQNQNQNMYNNLYGSSTNRNVPPQQSMTNAFNPFSAFTANQNYNRNPRDEVLLDGNPFQSQNPLESLINSVNYNPQDPSFLLTMQLLSDGKDSKDIVKDILEKQKLQHMKTYLDTPNPSQCPSVKPNRKIQCAGYSGQGLKADFNTCQARGCCFDVEAWQRLDDDYKEEAKKNAPVTTQAPETTTEDLPPWLKNGLANSGFGPSNPVNPFSSNNFRGRRSAGFNWNSPQQTQQQQNTDTDKFSRSMVNLNPNPFLPEEYQVEEVCTWINPFNGKHNLASLEPVIKQCCEQIMCYHAESSAAWAQWGEWGQCSATCGSGQRERTRLCVDGENVVDDGLCKGRNIHIEACNTNECPKMMPWSAWSTCSATCGTGLRTRHRQCSIIGFCQDQPTRDQENCKLQNCMSSWSSWSSCDRPCGGGVEIRNRYCTEPNCQVPPDEETRSCNVQYCEGWSNWASMDNLCMPINGQLCGTGRERVTRFCDGGDIGSPGCPSQDAIEKYIPCNLEPCPEWAPWAEWSDCQNTRQGKIRERMRSCPILGACGPEIQAIESIGCFTEWTSWSRCGWSTSTKTRKRYCQNSRLGCGEEDNSETVNCDSNSNSQSNQLRNSQNNFNTGYNSNSMG